MPAPRINGFTVAYAAAGGVILWSGITGETLSATLRGLLQGRAPTPVASPAAPVTSAPGAAAPATGNAAANQQTARLLAAPYGWSSGPQWTALVSLWEQESGWNQYAQNSSSGAYGIPQANPPTKLPLAGQPAGGSHPTVQISWGLAYIASVYGSPEAAWAHEQANGWY